MTSTKQGDRAKIGRSSRNKGASGERELVARLRELGADVHRGYVQFKQSDIVGLDGVHVECKRVERLNIWAAMEQAVTEAHKRKDGDPAVFFRKNRGEWLVCMRLPDWFKLWERSRNERDSS